MPASTASWSAADSCSVFPIDDRAQQGHVKLLAKHTGGAEQSSRLGRHGVESIDQHRSQCARHPRFDCRGVETAGLLELTDKFTDKERNSRATAVQVRLPRM